MATSNTFQHDHELQMLQATIAARKANLSIFELIFKLAQERWPIVWEKAITIKPDVSLKEVYEILELDEDYYTLTARMPTASRTGPLYRLLSQKQRDGYRETLQAMLAQIRKEVKAGERGGPEGILVCVLKVARDADEEEEENRARGGNHQSCRKHDQKGNGLAAKVLGSQ